MRPAIALVILAACGSSSREPPRGSIGKAGGAALGAAIAAAADAIEPWRCARLEPPVPRPAAPPGWAIDGWRLRRSGDPKAALRIAFVGEARGEAAPTTAALEELRAALDAAPVDVVVSLGGMGATAREIGNALEPLAGDAPWAVVAIPGDREPIAAHRAAIAELAAAGAPVLDGSTVRMIESEGVAIATLPGAPFAEHLGGAAEGCLHDDGDVAAILTELAAPGRIAVLATQRTPRGGSDRLAGGAHAGDLGLARALDAQPVDLVVHRAVDDQGDTGARDRKKPRAVIGVAVGAIDATLRYRADGERVLPSALLLTVGERELSWKPIAPRVVP